MNLKALLSQARKRAFDQSAGGGLDTPFKTHTELPQAPWRPAGYYRLFCAHGKPMWQPCASQTCRRDRREAEANYEKLCRGEL